MNLNVLLLEDVHASATQILETLPGAHIVRLKHAPHANEPGVMSQLNRVVADADINVTLLHL